MEDQVVATIPDMHMITSGHLPRCPRQPRLVTVRVRTTQERMAPQVTAQDHLGVLDKEQGEHMKIPTPRDMVVRDLPAIHLVTELPWVLGQCHMAKKIPVLDLREAEQEEVEWVADSEEEAGLDPTELTDY